MAPLEARPTYRRTGAQQWGSGGPAHGRKQSKASPVRGGTVAPQRKVVPWADTVILVVPHSAVREIVKWLGGDALQAKVLVDATDLLDQFLRAGHGLHHVGRCGGGEVDALGRRSPRPSMLCSSTTCLRGSWKGADEPFLWQGMIRRRSRRSCASALTLDSSRWMSAH